MATHDNRCLMRTFSRRSRSSFRQAALSSVTQHMVRQTGEVSFHCSTPDPPDSHQSVLPAHFVSPTVRSSGFFTSVPHDRIYLTLYALTDMFCQQQGISLDSTIQVTMKDRNTIDRIFRGRYRKAGSHYKPLVLRHLPSLVMLLLRHSFFTVGTEVLVQHHGTSMGSQWHRPCAERRPRCGRLLSTASAADAYSGSTRAI